MQVKFNKRNYFATPVGARESHQVYRALRQGTLDHLGSLPSLNLPYLSFQAYEVPNSRTLVAAAVGPCSQRIDTVYWLTPTN